MAQESQILCDGCGEVLFGKMKGIHANRNYVEVAGRVTTHGWNDKVHKNIFQHLTNGVVNLPQTERQWIGESLVFCNKSGIPCFAKWMDRRRGEIQFAYQQRRDASLRDLRNKEIEAEEEHERIYGR